MTSTQTQAPPARTLRAIVDKKGQSTPAYFTSPVWVTAPNLFAGPTAGNKIEPFTTGESYFADFIKTVDAATAEVYIIGWQINWDALLAPGVRLYDVIYRNAKRGVRFCVMPWRHANPVQTYDAQTLVVLDTINARLKSEGIKGGGRVEVLRAGSSADRNAAYFSHHQKLVIVDRKVAYVGGIDLSYGRYDDAKFELDPKANGRWFLNSYNPGVPPLRELLDKNLVNPDLITGAADSVSGAATAQMAKIEAGGYQMRYSKNSPINNNPRLEGNAEVFNALDLNQPRLPWQDVHSRIEGPAVSDLTRNFVVRWNTLASSSKKLPMPVPPREMPAAGKASIQVLRSAPAKLCAAEYAALPTKTGVPAPGGAQDHIQAAMIKLIGRAQRFVYIESQFFVSGFGDIEGVEDPDTLSVAAQFIKDGVDGISDASLNAMRRWDDDEGAALDRPPSNGVCAALIERCERSILDAARSKFHAYITLPVHPEGSLADATVAVQVFWTMQTLVFGSRSLLNGIRRALKARELRDKGDDGHMRVINDNSNREYESIALEACDEYVTLLNLRTWAKLGGRVVTEQVYVHTKLMIVDDLYALLGSANVNDRSLLGSRDSELAVLVMDCDTKRADINGAGSQQPVRMFAHELRKSVWKKLFGITGGVRPAAELVQAIEQPGIPDSWRTIQRVARRNAALYEAAFKFIPRNETPGKGGEHAQILPVFDKRRRRLEESMPFQEQFWREQQEQISAFSALDEVRGFITALPIDWTKGENNQIPFPTSAVVHLDPANRGKDRPVVASNAVPRTATSKPEEA